MVRSGFAARCALRVLGVLAALGCSSNDDGVPDGAPRCASRVEQRLVGAATDESYLGLASSQARAVVALVDGSGESDALCSGVLVAPGWVLSAGHCSALPSPVASVLRADASRTLVEVSHVEVHPSLDLALFALEPSAPSASTLELDVTPVLTSAVDLGLVPGDAVELAGCGVTESGSPEGPRFLVESIVEMDAESIVVDGFGVTGACTGDSGGPLLTRSSDGSLQVAGILSRGSPACVGRDRYVRLDAAAEWVTTVAGASPVPPEDCGSIDELGRCLRGAALWCDGGALQTAACAVLGKACGWDATEVGFRCVESDATACVDFDRVGECRGGATVACVDGARVSVKCGSCATCRIDGRTGAPYCSESD